MITVYNKPQKKNPFPKPCRMNGCPNLATSGAYCPLHANARAGENETKEKTSPPSGKIIYQQDRPSAYRRGYDHNWRKERKKFLMNHPWCVHCLNKGYRTPATEVDHIVPHKGNKRLFWNQDNWQALCKSCHSRKTAKEDMGGWR